MRSRSKLAAMAALALSLFGCMKAGDGVGLDPSGKIVPPVPFCTAHPNDPSCAVSTDPCVLNPTSKACSTSICLKDSTKPWCKQTVDCKATPTAPGCSVNVCLTNPNAPECKTTVKFAAVYAIIEANACLTCHVPGGPGVTQGKLNLATADSAYANLVRKAASVASVAPGWVRVNPTKPDSSILIVKIEAKTATAKMPSGTGYGARMPLGLDPLLPADLATVRQWILDGAEK